MFGFGCRTTRKSWSSFCFCGSRRSRLKFRVGSFSSFGLGKPFLGREVEMQSEGSRRPSNCHKPGFHALPFELVSTRGVSKGLWLLCPSGRWQFPLAGPCLVTNVHPELLPDYWLRTSKQVGSAPMALLSRVRRFTGVGILHASRLQTRLSAFL